MDNKISTEKMAMTLGISSKTVKRHIKDIGIVRFIGRGSNGHWEIIGDQKYMQNVIMTENKDVYKKLPLAYRGRYDIFTVLLSEGDTTITLLCERVNSTSQFCKLLLIKI